MAVKILLAEDDTNLRETLAEGLRAEGYEVTAVANGAAALELVAQGFNAAVLDGLLPKMTGFDVAKQMRAKSPSTAIVLMSGVFKGSQQQTDHMQATGAKAYLVKPFDLKKLIDTLRPLAPPPAGSPSLSSPGAPGAPGPQSPLPGEGNLLEMPGLFLGWRIHKEGHTGILELFGAGSKARIFAYRGRAVFAQHSDPLLHIGVELLKDGTLTTEQFKSVCDTAVSRGSGIYEVIKGEGLATEAQMKLLYKGLVPRIIERTPAMTGHFRWTATDAFSSIVPAASASVLESMLSGIIKASEKDLEPHVGPRRPLRLAPGDNWAEVTALLTQACGSDSLTRAINGRATVAQMLEVSPTAQERATRFRQVFVLMSTMAVRASEEAISMAQPAPQPMQAPRTPTPPPAPQQVMSASSSAGSGRVPRQTSAADVQADAAIAFTADEKQARARIEARYAEMFGKNHWEILGVAKGVDANSLKKAFYQLSRDFHPDSFAGLQLGSSSKKLELVFQAIQEANETLSNDAKRGEYEAKHSFEAGGGSSDVGALFQAESDFQRVKSLYDRGELVGAAKLIDRIVAVMPNHEEVRGYKLFLDWWATKNPATAEKTTRALQELWKVAPAANALGDFQGWIYMETGNLKYARGTFKKVLEMDPKHIGANRGLTLANRKADEGAKSPSGGGTLGKFFGVGKADDNKAGKR